MDLNSKIYIAGHRGLVGSAILKKLQEKGYKNFLLRSRSELDLVDQKEVNTFFKEEKPDYVFFAAAKVGGIQANNVYRAQFIYENLQIQNNIIHNSFIHRVKKLLFLGSSCIYPKNSPQPIKEDYLLTGELEYTNEPYALAKIAGMKMCESYNLQYGTNFISVMPTNLFGPNDNYDLEKSHVLPALIRKIYLAKLYFSGDFAKIIKNLQVDNFEQAEEILAKNGITNKSLKIWGSGNPRREFLHSEDMAEACIFVMENINFSDLSKDKNEVKHTHLNIGTGKDISIRELAELIKNIADYQGELLFDQSKPDGTKQKLLDISKIKGYGWVPRVSLADGVSQVYTNYLALS